MSSGERDSLYKGKNFLHCLDTKFFNIKWFNEGRLWSSLYLSLNQYADDITRIRTRAGMPKLFLQQPKKLFSKILTSRTFSLTPKHNEIHSVFREKYLISKDNLYLIVHVYYIINWLCAFLHSVFLRIEKHFYS